MRKNWIRITPRKFHDVCSQHSEIMIGMWWSWWRLVSDTCQGKGAAQLWTVFRCFILIGLVSNSKLLPVENYITIGWFWDMCIEGTIFWSPIRNRGPYGYCCNFRGMHGCRVRNTLSWPMMGAAVWSQSDLYVPSIPLTADLQTCKRDASTRNISYITWQAFNLIVRLGIVSSYWW